MTELETIRALSLCLNAVVADHATEMDDSHLVMRLMARIDLLESIGALVPAEDLP